MAKIKSVTQYNESDARMYRQKIAEALILRHDSRICKYCTSYKTMKPDAPPFSIHPFPHTERCPTHDWHHIAESIELMLLQATDSGYLEVKPNP